MNKPAPMTQPHVVSFGCRLNTLESEILRGQIDGQNEDLVLVNTCAVTKEAERQARQTIRRIKRQRPQARIIVTGCAAQASPKTFAAMNEVSRVLGNAEKMSLGKFLDEIPLAGPEDKITVSDMASQKTAKSHLVGGIDGRTRALVQIQQGCDHRCTFCIVPSTRGPSRSHSDKSIIAQVRTLVENGYREIVLTGVDISSYGADLANRPNLAGLAKLILTTIPELERLRFSSIDLGDMDGDLFRLLAEEPRFMPHLHISLQAGDDIILKRMKRRHSRSQALKFCQTARKARPDVVFGADLIAGFPTESDRMFKNTLASIDDMGLTFLHVFPFSSRPGTAAAKMPQVAVGIRKNRARALRQAGESAKRRYLESLIGETTQILVEDENKGYTPHFAPVTLGLENDAFSPAGGLVDVKILNIEDARLFAKACS
jgi:threonylcarbamoyladenosine tRNA methylthiotransferase MtaB